MPELNLDGVGVLVTRPRHQAGDLSEAIVSRGGTVIAFPVIQIDALDAAIVLDDVAKLEDPAITIFISRNAVDHGLRHAKGKLAAIGPSTSEAIEKAGAVVDIRPSSGFDTEHLLAEPALDDVAGKTIRIIRGDRGRELLANELEKRGAHVDCVSTYQRNLPAYAADELDSLEQRWRAGDVSAVVTMSNQSLENLGVLLPDWCRKQLIRTPLVTPSARVLKEAMNQYPGCPAVLAAGPRTSDMVDALFAARASLHPDQINE